MKKIIVVFIGVILLTGLGVFVIAQNTSNSEVSQIVDSILPGNVSQGVSGYVSSFVNKRGINPQEIKNIEEVDFNSLPKEVNIENVGDHNLAIYQIDYTENGQDDQVYVITYSVEELKAQGDLIVAHDKRQFLNFGFVGTMADSDFLKTATGVETSLEKGYVMVRDGSITGISTNLNVIQGNPGSIEIIVYKNGEPIGFGNTFDSSSVGMKKDYDVQSRDVVTFKAGDVISVYLKAEGQIAWEDVITIVEITTIN